MDKKESEAKFFFSSDIKEIRYIVLDSFNETLKNKKLLQNEILNNPEMVEIKIRELLGKVRDAYVSEYIQGTTDKDVKEYVSDYFKNSKIKPVKKEPEMDKDYKLIQEMKKEFPESTDTEIFEKVAIKTGKKSGAIKRNYYLYLDKTLKKSNNKK